MNKKVIEPRIAPLIRKLLRETPPPEIVAKYKDDLKKAHLMNQLIAYQWKGITKKQLMFIKTVVGGKSESDSVNN